MLIRLSKNLQFELEMLNLSTYKAVSEVLRVINVLFLVKLEVVRRLLLDNDFRQHLPKELYMVRIVATQVRTDQWLALPTRFFQGVIQLPEDTNSIIRERTVVTAVSFKVTMKAKLLV